MAVAADRKSVDSDVDVGDNPDEIAVLPGRNVEGKVPAIAPAYSNRDLPIVRHGVVDIGDPQDLDAAELVVFDCLCQCLASRPMNDARLTS